MSADKKAYPLRITGDVLDAVQRWADDELRSVNAQIEYVLREALRALVRWPPHEHREAEQRDAAFRVAEHQAAQRALAKARENAARHAAAAAANVDSKEFAGRAKRAQDALTQEENTSSRLFVIDAGLDAHALRQKYPDRTRFMLLHGTVRPSIRDRGPGQPQATGYVARVGGGPVHVSHALRGPLESLRARGEPGGDRLRRDADAGGLRREDAAGEGEVGVDLGPRRS